MGAAGRRLATGLGLLLVIGVAWTVRVLDAPAIFTPQGIRAAGPDAYYHLRRVRFGYVHFPAVLERDPYLNHPHGGDVIWPPGLDWSVAGLARLRLGVDAPAERLERFALALPPWLGVLAVAGCFAWGTWRFGAGAGLVAAGLLAVLPASFFYSRLGMLDHHALEPVFTLAFLAAGTSLVTSRRGAGAAIGFAAATAAAFWVWPGFLLQLVLVETVLLGVVVLAPPGPTVRRVACAAAAGHALAALALLPAWGRENAYWGRFAPVVLGGFQPWWLACGATVLASVCLAARRPRAWRVSAAAGVALALLAGSAVLLPDLAAAPGRMWSWLARTEGFQAQVSESLPLLAAGPQGRLEASGRLLSYGVFVLPLVLWLHARQLARGGREALRGWVLVAMALGLGLATLAQRRFANAFSVPTVLLFGWLLGSALPAWLRARTVSSRVRVAVVVAACVAVVLALVPAAGAMRPALERRARRAAGEPVTLARDQWRRHELHRLAEWLRQNTPPTSGWLDAAAKPEYGILAHWTDGHVLEYVARRPTVVSNFGDDLGEAGWQAGLRYFRLAEPEASALLDDLRVRYVILESRRAQAPFQRFDEHSMTARGFFADGASSEASLRRRSGRDEPVSGEFAAFERHRLVHETRGKPWAPEEPFFKVYEHVAGAHVVGRAPADTTVSFALELETGTGRRFTWRARARTDAAGRYALRLPYATRGAPPDLRIAPVYRVEAAGRRAALVVEERDVQSGRRLRGPDLSVRGPDLSGEGT